MYRTVEPLAVIVQIADCGNDPAPGLLGRLLGNALPAFELLIHIRRLGDAAGTVEKHDLSRARLRAFLHEEIGTLALRQAGKHQRVHARLRRTWDDLQDLGLALLLRDLDEAAFVVLARAVADDDVLARLHTQHPDVLRVAPADDGRAAHQIGACHEKLRHKPSSSEESVAS